MAFVFLLVLASVPLAGGRLRGLSDLRLQRAPLVVLALALQVVMTYATGLPRPLLVALHLCSYALVAVVLWVNRALPGLLVLAAGGATNAGVIALNGGTLPASAAALRRAGWAQDGEFANSAALEHPRLAWLGDVVATPGWLPFRNVISIGDVLILVGAAWLVHAACGSRLPGVVRVLRGWARWRGAVAPGLLAPAPVRRPLAAGLPSSLAVAPVLLLELAAGVLLGLRPWAT